MKFQPQTAILVRDGKAGLYERIGGFNPPCVACGYGRAQHSLYDDCPVTAKNKPFRASRSYAIPCRNIVSRCTHMRLGDGEFSGGEQVRCTSYLLSDGSHVDNCGEPCRWIMRKGGEGYPPND